MVKSLVVFALCFLPQVALATPKTVIIIRHGEKEGDVLSAAGQKRANNLVGWFRDTLAPKYGVPVALYAFHPKQSGKRERGVETLTPLSDELRLPIDAFFKENDEAALANEIKKKKNYDGQLVVICWEHSLIGDIAAGFGVKDTPKWPDDDFDRAWILNFDDQGKASFKQIKEKFN